MKTVKYRVKKDDFDAYQGGEIINVILICQDMTNDIALVFHPPRDRETIGCLEFARKTSNDIYVPTSSKTYINIELDLNQIEVFVNAMAILA